MGKIIPILLAVLGTGAGVGAGVFLQPDAAEKTTPEVACAPVDDEDPAVLPPDEEQDSTHEFVKMNNQFVVPVMDDGHVKALVVASISIEVTAGNSEQVYQREPKLRDQFLQVLFDHAHLGGFDGDFTRAEQMQILRRGLRETAQSILGNTAKDILITEIARQDV